MDTNRRQKNNRKVLEQILELMMHRPLFLHYQYFVLTMLSLRYFHQFFTHADVLVRTPKTLEPQFYRTTTEQFNIFSFYLIYDKARWSYITQEMRQESLCVSLYNAAKDMREYFPSLRNNTITLYEIPPLDEMILQKMVKKIDSIAIDVDDPSHKKEFVDLMQFVIDKGQPRKPS